MSSNEQEIPFTDEHVEKIREGKKQTTLRTIKKDNLYRIGETYRIAEDLKVQITGRQIITFGYEKCEAYDESAQLFPNTAAKHDALSKLEGFENDENYPDEGNNSLGKMFDWFESRGYNLPQEFFMYKLNPKEVPQQGDQENEG